MITPEKIKEVRAAYELLASINGDMDVVGSVRDTFGRAALHVSMALERVKPGQCVHVSDLEDSNCEK